LRPPLKLRRAIRALGNDIAKKRRSQPEVDWRFIGSSPLFHRISISLRNLGLNRRMLNTECRISKDRAVSLLPFEILYSIFCISINIV
jgi:hypothetical protein